MTVQSAPERAAEIRQVLAMARSLLDQFQSLESRLEQSLNVADDQKGLLDIELVPCDAEHNAALERVRNLEEQMRAMLEGLPALVEQAVQRLEEKNESRLEQMWSHWLQEREQRLSQTEDHPEAVPASPLFQPPEQEQITKLIGLLESQKAGRQEARFVKSLLWVTVSAFALAFVLVVYVVLPRV